MFNRSKAQKKTCWSIVVNLLSEASPTKLLLGYLYVSSQLLGAKAQNAMTETFYYGSMDGEKVPSSACITSAPTCLLSAKGIFSENKLTGFEVSQKCCEESRCALKSMEEATLADQFNRKEFYGDRLCNGTLTNTLNFEDPLKSRTATNTNYAVKLDREDRVEITYSP